MYRVFDRHSPIDKRAHIFPAIFKKSIGLSQITEWMPNRKKKKALRPQDSRNLAIGFTQILNVMERVVADHDVERLMWESSVLESGSVEIFRTRNLSSGSLKHFSGRVYAIDPPKAHALIIGCFVPCSTASIQQSLFSRRREMFRDELVGRIRTGLENFRLGMGILLNKWVEERTLGLCIHLAVRERLEFRLGG